MARPTTFDREQVLAQTMSCFWQHGYTATSMKHLEVATQLTPGSLYNSFGSKDGLFLESLDHYTKTIMGERIYRYLKPAEGKFVDEPLLGIEEFISSGFYAQGNDLHLGCLLVNTSTELGPHHQVVRKKIHQTMMKVLTAVEHALVRSQQLGQLDESIDTKQRAQLLGLVFNGMLVQWRAADDSRWLNAAMGGVRQLLH